MKILFISPDIEFKGRGITMILRSLIESAKREGHEVGLLVGIPEGIGFNEAKSKEISLKLNHLHLQHYMKEGRDSFRYLNPKGLTRRTIIKSILTREALKSKTFRIKQDLLSGEKSMLNDVDFAVKSPYIYQIMGYAPSFLPQKLVERIVKKNNIDMIVMASPSRLSNRGMGCLVAHFVHDAMPIELVEAPPDNNTPARYAKQFFSTCTSSDIIFTNSNDTEKKVLEVNPQANTHVLYGTASSRRSDVQPSSIVENLELKPKKFLLFISTIEKRKNLSNLLDAYAQIHAEINMPLIIAGGMGYGSEEIMAKHKSLSNAVRNDVKFLGYISEADKYALYDKAFAFVFPSIYEGIGLMLIEAMESNLPIITSRRGALPEAGGDAAYYVEDPYDAKEIAQAIKTLAGDPKLVKQLVKNGNAQAKKFTIEKFAERFKKALRSVEQ